MINFYPGPSRIYPDIPKYVKHAYYDGYLSFNHRSTEVNALIERTIQLVREKLRVPEDYIICFVSSATECWEIIAQSLVRESTLHLYNGAFGEKWFENTKKLRLEAQGVIFGLNEELPVHQISGSPELICITHNETSNGTLVSNDIIRKLRKQNSESLIAVDATSSMAGIYIDFSRADIWYASVQKCFGLPAGMGIMMLSPAATAKAYEVNEKSHYNSLVSIIEQIKNYQTTHTPNVLDIYLLMRVMEVVKGIKKVHEKTEDRYNDWEKFIDRFSSFKHLVTNAEVRSKTVLTLEADEAVVKEVKEKSRRSGFVLGNGYGAWKNNTFRIANFPAIKSKEIKILMNFMESNFS